MKKKRKKEIKPFLEKKKERKTSLFVICEKKIEEKNHFIKKRTSNLAV